MLVLDVKLKQVDGNPMFCRDCRPLAGIYLVFVALPVAYASLSPGTFAAGPLEIGGLLAALTVLVLGGCYFYHGAILVNRTLNQVEIYKDVGFKHPSETIESTELSSVSTKTKIETNMQGPDTKSFRVVLGLKENGESAPRVLALAFWTREAADECGRAIAELADAPFQGTTRSG